MSRADESFGWGKFDIRLCDGNDYTYRFLINEKMSYFLYLWEKEDEFDLVLFSCAHIPTPMTIDSNIPSLLL